VGDTPFSGVQVVPTDPPDKWSLKMTPPGSENLQKDEVEDVILMLGYEWK
jgi:hypothetical protein